MQTCWQTLQIEATQDKRAIKLAYAKLIKVTRPDQDPEEFSKLHDAYKEAQWLANSPWYWQDNHSADFIFDKSTTPHISEPAALNEKLASLAVNVIQLNQPSIDNVLMIPSSIRQDTSNNSTGMIADDASAFFESMLLSNEWIGQVEKASLGAPLSNEAWQTLLSKSHNFDNETRNQATNLLLGRVYFWYQNALDYGYGGFWEALNKECDGWNKKLLSLFAQTLNWWTPQNDSWKKEFDLNFLEVLFDATASKEERQAQWRGSFFKFRRIPEPKHIGPLTQAAPWRRVTAKVIDFLFFYLLIQSTIHFMPKRLSESPNLQPTDVGVKLPLWLIAALIFLFYEITSQRGFIGAKIMGIKLAHPNNGAHPEPVDVMYYFMGWASRLLITVAPPLWFIIKGLAIQNTLTICFGLGCLFFVYYFSLRDHLMSRNEEIWVVLR
jgi:hypothetical protein